MTATSHRRNGKQQLPTYYAFQVVEPPAEGKSPRWVRLGAFFSHPDGQGGTLMLDALPIQFDGRIVLRAPVDEDAEQ